MVLGLITLAGVWTRGELLPKEANGLFASISASGRRRLITANVCIVLIPVPVPVLIPSSPCQCYAATRTRTRTRRTCYFCSDIFFPHTAIYEAYGIPPARRSSLEYPERCLTNANARLNDPPPPF